MSKCAGAIPPALVIAAANPYDFRIKDTSSAHPATAQDPYP